MASPAASVAASSPAEALADERLVDEAIERALAPMASPFVAPAEVALSLVTAGAAPGVRVRIDVPGRDTLSLRLPLVPRAGEIVELPGAGSAVESFDVIAVRWRLDPAGAPPTAALELRARR